MKTTILLSLMLGLSAAALLSAKTVTAAPAADQPLAPGPASDATSTLRPFAPGLVVTEYPRHDLQANEKENFYVPLEKLGSQSETNTSSSRWTPGSGKPNAMP